MSLLASNLCFGYHPGSPVLVGVSASFEPGAITAILGPNGSGKTTLLRLLLGLLHPGSGEASLDGRPVHAMREPERAARMAYIPQRPSVAFSFSVLDVVALGCGPGTPAARARRAAGEALETVGLTDRGADPFGELSAGQQQRAVLARALAQLATMPPGASPPALLADEPTSAMDPRHALEAMALFRQQAASGRVVVVVLHDLTAAVGSADRALVLDRTGHVAACGPVRATLDRATILRVFDVDVVELVDDRTAVRALIPALPAAGR